MVFINRANHLFLIVNISCYFDYRNIIIIDRMVTA